MRKQILLIILVILLLIACTPTATKDDITIEMGSIEDDLSIVSLLADEVYSWKIFVENDEISELEVIVDYFKNGVKQEPMINLGTAILDSEKSELELVLATQSIKDEMKWTVGFIDDSGMSAASREVEPDGWDDDLGRTFTSVATPATVQKGETIGMAVIILDEPGTSVHATTNVDDTEEQFKDYQHVYFIQLKSN